MTAAERGSARLTSKAYRSDLEDFHAFLDARGRDIVNVGRDQISDYLGVMARAGMAANTQARRLSCLRQFYRFLVAEKLREVDSDHAAAYEEHLAAFLQQLDQRIVQWQQDTASIQRREVVAYHNQWPYLARFTGVRIERFLEPKPGIPPTPKQLAVLQKYMQDQQIRVIVQSSYFPTRVSESLAKRTDAQVVLLCQSVGEASACSDYLALLEHNVHQLTEALGR